MQKQGMYADTTSDTGNEWTTSVLDLEHTHLDFSKKELLVLTKDNQIEETLFLGLRMMEGVSLSAFEEHFHCPLTVIYQREIQKLTEKGLLRMEEDRIFLTEKGIDLSNMVLSEFLLG